jgi:hypothetical protein
MIWLDSYERRSRLVPGLLALLPVAVTVLALGLNRIPLIAVAGSLLSAAGGPLLLAGLVRHLGLQAQDGLWLSWGGAPTTLSLRLRGQNNNPVQRQSWRLAVQEVTGHRLLTARAELADPAKADNTIEAAVADLRELTRSRRFSMVATENKNYGFERNLYGLRWVGRTIALLAVAVTAGLLAFGQTGGAHLISTAGAAAGLVINAGLLALWFFAPSTARVRTVADRYAHQLLQAAVTLAKFSASSPDKPQTEQSA